MLHLAVRHRGVNQHLYQEGVGQAFLSEIITRVVGSPHICVQYMVCRTLCNSFLHPAGLKLLLAEEMQERIMDTVLSFDSTYFGLLPEDESEKHLRVDTATLLLNFAIAVGRTKAEAGMLRQCSHRYARA